MGAIVDHLAAQEHGVEPMPVVLTDKRVERLKHEISAVVSGVLQGLKREN